MCINLMLFNYLATAQKITCFGFKRFTGIMFVLLRQSISMLRPFYKQIFFQAYINRHLQRSNGHFQSQFNGTYNLKLQFMVCT